MTNAETLANFVRRVADKKLIQYYMDTFGCKSVYEAIMKHWGSGYYGETIQGNKITTDNRKITVLGSDQYEPLIISWMDLADMVVELLPEYDNRGNVQLNLFEFEEDEEGDYEDE